MARPGLKALNPHQLQWQLPGIGRSLHRSSISVQGHYLALLGAAAAQRRFGLSRCTLNLIFKGASRCRHISVDKSAIRSGHPLLAICSFKLSDRAHVSGKQQRHCFLVSTGWLDGPYHPELQKHVMPPASASAERLA